jgi:2-polyprenyl-6-methoxyphenol hydroxylase-like FAD-dependent oxidoreductase
MTTNTSKPYGHAIVLGGSMAGLVTARALSRHFERVTIVERDAVPTAPAARAGVPQGEHLHALLPGGADAIESLLPGFAAGLLDSGAVSFGAPTELIWLSAASWMGRFPAQHRMLSASRNLIEWHTRRLVLATPGVELIDRRCVLDLEVDADRSRVTGVTLGRSGVGDPPSGPIERLDGDLVVDATGRRSRLPDWLERRGYDRPTETKIDAHLAYATRIYRTPPGERDWKALFVQSQPPVTSRMGILFPIEGDRWMVTVQGVGDDRPPTDEDGFVEFASGLRSPVIADAIRHAEPLSDPVGFANTANRRRHYERIRNWPERLLVVGDSACSFNPVYGQGISVAAQTAVVLDAQLARHAGAHRSLDGFVRRMQRRVAKAGDPAWMIATGDDLRMPTTTGATATRSTRMQHRYLDRVIAAANTDPIVQAAMMRVFFLLAPPTLLFRPNVVARSLFRRRPAGVRESQPCRARESEHALVP